MKELKLPVNDKDVIEIAEISINYGGIIIGYYKETPIGHIIYNIDSDYWEFNEEIRNDCPSVFKDNLIDLIKNLIEDKICTNFKVITYRN